MRAGTFVCVVVALALVAEVGSLRGNSGEATKSDRVAALIKQLGERAFARREAARKELEDIGEPALAALRRAATSSDDLEIRRRAERIIQTIATRAENFNSYSGTQNAIQWQSGLKVAHSGSVTGWTKTGENSMHAVDRANRAGQSNPQNWAVMIWQDNVLTSGAIAANASGQVYRVEFEASAAVYAATHPQQATQAGDALLIEVLRGDGRVLASHRHSPGAWTGTLAFAAAGFQYTGDGSGDVRLRIKPAGPQTSGRFHGAIDNIIVRKAAVRSPKPAGPPER
jgi:hypothetical protein